MSQASVLLRASAHWSPQLPSGANTAILVYDHRAQVQKSCNLPKDYSLKVAEQWLWLPQGYCLRQTEHWLPLLLASNLEGATSPVSYAFESLKLPEMKVGAQKLLMNEWWVSGWVSEGEKDWRRRSQPDSWYFLAEEASRLGGFP